MGCSNEVTDLKVFNSLALLGNVPLAMSPDSQLLALEGGLVKAVPSCFGKIPLHRGAQFYGSFQTFPNEMTVIAEETSIASDCDNRIILYMHADVISGDPARLKVGDTVEFEISLERIGGGETATLVFTTMTVPGLLADAGSDAIFRAPMSRIAVGDIGAGQWRLKLSTRNVAGARGGAFWQFGYWLMRK